MTASLIGTGRKFDRKLLYCSKVIRVAPEEASILALIPAFWEAYHERTGALGDNDSVRRASAHAAACALARIDGKSPVDYLDEPRREATRRFALAAGRAEPAAWDELVRLLAREMRLFN